jgi:hypothetical protein
VEAKATPAPAPRPAPALDAAAASAFREVPTAQLPLDAVSGSTPRLSVGDTPTDPAPAQAASSREQEIEAGLPPAIGDDWDEESTAVTRGSDLEKLVRQAEKSVPPPADLPSSGSTLGDDFEGFLGDRKQQTTVPFDSRSVLMDAISEEAEKLSNPPGAQPLASRVREDAPAESGVTRAVAKAKSREGVLTVLLAICLMQLGYIYFLQPHGLETNPDLPKVVPLDPSATPKPRPRPAGESAKAAQGTGGEPATGQEAAPSATAADTPTAAPGEAAEAAGKPTDPAAVKAGQPAPAQPSGTTEPAPAKPVAKVPEQASAAVPAAPAGNPDSLVREGNRLLRERKPAEAKASFEAALATDPKNPHAHAGLSEALLDSGDAAGAQLSAETAVRLRPRRAGYRVLLGDALRARGRSEEAKAAYEKALEIDPSDTVAQKRLGN